MSFLHTFVLLLDFLWPRSAMACAGLLAAFPRVLTWVNHVNNLVGVSKGVTDPTLLTQ